MTLDSLLRQIKADAKTHGSQAALAEAMQISTAYLSDVLSGRRHPGAKVLDHYGLAERTEYVRKGK